jgi:nucleoside 2-deoxyribosyltransferase
MKIYFAGPLFSTAEQSFNRDLRNYLVLNGHEVFLPQESEENIKALDEPDVAAERIFHSDVAGIDWADVVLANLDGPDPDSGTCWEIGYAYANDKFIIVYRTDLRIHKGFDPINLMLTESANAVILMDVPTISVLGSAICDELRLYEDALDGVDDETGGS